MSRLDSSPVIQQSFARCRASVDQDPTRRTMKTAVAYLEAIIVNKKV